LFDSGLKLVEFSKFCAAFHEEDVVLLDGLEGQVASAVVNAGAKERFRPVQVLDGQVDVELASMI